MDENAQFYIMNAINVKKRNISDYKDIGFLIVDEVHVMATKVMVEAFQYITPRYCLALSATPYRSDGLDEVFVDYESRGFCGSGGCTKYIIEKKKDKSNWEVIWQGFGGRGLTVSSNKTNGYSDIYFGASKCTYKDKYKCLDPY